MQQTINVSGLPEVILLGSLTLSIPTNDEVIADKYFNDLVDRIKYEFSAKRRRLAFFYELDIEIEEIAPGSRRYLTKPKLKLKSKWKRFQRASMLAGSFFAAIAAYPAVKDGATEIYNDFQAVVEHVIQDEQQRNPEISPTIESCTPNDDKSDDEDGS